MRIVKLLLISAFAFGILIFLISLLFPSRAIVERSGVIDAPLSVVYSQVNNLSGWPAWNPWADPGTAQEVTYSAPASGSGAYYTWAGMQHEKHVTGKVTIRESDPQKGIHYDMEFNDMKTVNAAFELKPSADGKGTAIQWRLETHLGWLPWWKLRGFLADKLTGPQLEDGLTRLKNICEEKKR